LDGSCCSDDEAEALHRISSPEAVNRDEDIQIWSNPIAD